MSSLLACPTNNNETMLPRVQHDFHIRCGSCCTLDSKTTSVTRVAGTTNPSGTHEFISDLYWGSCFSIFCFLCRVLYLYFFFWSLHCLPFYLRRLITPLVFKRFLKWADNLDENCINLSLWIQNCTHPDKIPSRVYQQ